MVTTQATVPTKQTSINSSPPFLPTLKLTMGSTIFLMANTLTKYIQLDFVEEMLYRIIAVVALITPQIFSHSFVQIKKKQLYGMKVTCYATHSVTYLTSRKLALLSVSITTLAYQPIMWYCADKVHPGKKFIYLQRTLETG